MSEVKTEPSQPLWVGVDNEYCQAFQERVDHLNRLRRRRNAGFCYNSYDFNYDFDEWSYTWVEDL